jgi:D-lactate dehydrogenase (cytochrome)
MLPNCFQRLRLSTSLGINLARSRFIRQHALTFTRPYSSSVPIGGPRSWSPIIIGSIASGLIGYSLSALGTPSLASQALGETEPKYGTPKDFELAIKELRASFDSDEIVSTHPEDLRIHGFSEHDHHASEDFPCAEPRISLLILALQAYHTPSSYPQGVRKM